MTQKTNPKIKPEKPVALNVPMDAEFMDRIQDAAKKMHVGKAAYARMALEEKLQKDKI
jgi:hypothetical protein